MKSVQVAIVGGGIAGLVAATALARLGLQPTLFEAAPEVGGRAQTRVVDGFCFQGPGALYLSGALNAHLTELGLSAAGGRPPFRGGLAVWGEEAHPLPIRPKAAEATPPLSLADTACLAETFARIAGGDCGARGTPLGAFTSALPPAVGAVIEAFVRLSTYVHAPEHIDCKAALDQLRLGSGGVLYIDGGWRTLISQLAGAATAAGAALRPEHRVVAVRRESQAWRIELAAHPAELFDTVIVAVPPSAARDLVESSAHIAAAASRAQPLPTMCLDLGLTSPEPGAKYALGIDAPTYMSLQSATAELAPPGAGLLHLSRYLAPGEAPSAAHLEELERMADWLQPGWRGRLAHKQRLIGITVAQDYPRWANGGRRAPAVVADAPGLFLAGDWVGDEGMLSDAAAASALVAAREAAAYLAGVPA